MVDISKKRVTKRTALACASVTMKRGAFKKMMRGDCPKGQVFETAKIAGLLAAKSTSQVIPMCHPLEIQKADIFFSVDEDKNRVCIFAEIMAKSRTGVEMEALTAVSMAALTIYDMMKWADKGIVISDMMLIKKTGGASGDYSRPVAFSRGL